MKKNLFILIYSLASGGAERVVSILLNELKDKYNITLVLMNDTIFYDIPKNLQIIYLENSNQNESRIKKLLKLPLLAWKYKKINKSDISLSFMNRPNYVNIIAKLMGMKRGNSKGNAKDLTNNFNIKKVDIIYNPDGFIFVTVGRLDNGKNHELIIKAMQDIDAKLYIIGEGELKNNLELTIKSLELKDKVFLLGRQENPYKYLAKSEWTERVIGSR